MHDEYNIMQVSFLKDLDSILLWWFVFLYVFFR